MTPPVTGFSKTGFTKHTWDRDGKTTPGDEFFLGNQTVTIDRLMKLYETTSLMARWRQANPSLVGSENDILVKTAKSLREVLGNGREELVVGVGCALLLFKKD